MRKLLCFVMLCFGFSTMLQASTLQVSVSGTYSNTAPTTTYSTPGGTFTYTFLVDSNPTFTNGLDEFVPMGVQYTLNGNSVATAVQIAFLRQYNLTICLAPTCPSTPDNYLSIDTRSKLYSGPNTSPMVSAGAFTTIDGYSSYGAALASVSNINIAAVSTTPEPSSLLLLGTGLVSVCGLAGRKLVAARHVEAA